jgi:hypothetical protein
VSFFSPSLSPLWAFWCTFFYHHPDIVCCLPYILHCFLDDSFTLLVWRSYFCIALFSSIRLVLSFAFCTAFVSFLLSHHCSCFYPPCSLCSCCAYDTSSSFVSLIFPLIYDHLTPPRADDSDIRHQGHCSPSTIYHKSMYVCYSFWVWITHIKSVLITCYRTEIHFFLVYRSRKVKFLPSPSASEMKAKR